MYDNSGGYYPRIVPMSTNASPQSVQLPTDEELVLKVIPMPADCNALRSMAVALPTSAAVEAASRRGRTAAFATLLDAVAG